MARIKVILHPSARQPIIPSRGSGLNASNQPKQPAVAVVNPFARNFRGK